MQGRKLSSRWLLPLPALAAALLVLLAGQRFPGGQGDRTPLCVASGPSQGQDLPAKDLADADTPRANAARSEEDQRPPADTAPVIPFDFEPQKPGDAAPEPLPQPAEPEPQPSPPQPEPVPEPEPEPVEDYNPGPSYVEPEDPEEKALREAEEAKYRPKFTVDRDKVRPPNALDWLRDHQHVDGGWRAVNFGDDRKRLDATRTFNLEFQNVGTHSGDVAATSALDIGLTGLALGVFVGAGFDHKQGDYKETVRRALIYLRKCMRSEPKDPAGIIAKSDYIDGCFGDKGSFMAVFNHSFALAAMAEAWGLSGDNLLKPIVERGVEFLLEARGPNGAWGYRYQDTRPNLRCTAWAVWALKSAQMAGIEFDFEAPARAACEWIGKLRCKVQGQERMCSEPGYLEASDVGRGANGVANPLMEAMALVCLAWCAPKGAKAEDLKTEANLALFARVKAHPVRWKKGEVDFEYVYWATNAMLYYEQDAWKTWSRPMLKEFHDAQRGWRAEDWPADPATTDPATTEPGTRTQRHAVDEAGSWDPVDASGYGRLWSTTLAAMAMETAWRTYRWRTRSDKK